MIRSNLATLTTQVAQTVCLLGKPKRISNTSVRQTSKP
jgi:hypothetical protein